MTKRHARNFFLVCTIGFALIFIGMTIDSHRQFDKLTNAQNITPDVTAGKDVWHAQNCINCHTLLGEGAYYAPDLTKITQQRGSAYLEAFLKDPSQFYSNEKHRRVMPNPNLSETEIKQVIAFLDWVSKIDNQGWPPRPILVSGGTFPGTAKVGQPPAPEGGAGKTLGAPAARGQALFSSPPANCSACHSVSPGVNLAGPSLAGIATLAGQTVKADDYKGKATDAKSFIKESILEPSAYLVPGPQYSAGGTSFMPSNYREQLSEEQVDELVAYLMTLE